jgi:L-ascorbate metabolism protein UlaG (beta-lactamase superfamily)
MLETVRWHGHATIRIEAGGSTIIIDPYGIKEKRPVDLVLITHSHYDHLSDADLDKVRGSATRFVGPADCRDRLGPKASVMVAGATLEVLPGISIAAFPAYNLNKKFHPKDKGWLGYVITVDGVRYYVAGDTDRIPEMKDIRCDVAFLPVGGTYTMTADEAAEAVGDIQPQVAVPIHWGTIVGSRTDAVRFTGLCGEKGRLLDAQP